MKLQKILFLALSVTALPVLLPSSARAATVDQAELEAYLHERYYEVEFFVFERPTVLDFATEEILTLHRPRALPRAVRTQRLDPEELWDGRLDTLTRACLTFPTLTYKLLPDESDSAQPLSAEPTAATGLPAARPTPVIEPTLAPNPQLDFLAHMAEFERALAQSSERWQPEENFRLQRAANRIERRGYGRILFHGRWLQAVPPREMPAPVLVLGGERLNPPQPSRELIGSVSVTLGRYLHFKADLFFQGPGLGLEPAGAAMDAMGESLLLVSDPGAPRPGYMQLSESRRMRSEEMHYLDHPKLGLIVRIDPVTFPEALKAKLENLKALEESTE